MRSTRAASFLKQTRLGRGDVGQNGIAVLPQRSQVLGDIRQAALCHGHWAEVLDLWGHLHGGLRAFRSAGLVLVKHQDGDAQIGCIVSLWKVIRVHHPGVDQALAKCRILLRILRHVLEDIEQRSNFTRA